MTITPEKIKQLIPDYQDKAITEYGFCRIFADWNRSDVSTDDPVFFNEIEMIDYIKQQLDDDPYYLCNATIETNYYQVDIHRIWEGDAVIVYHFNDEDEDLDENTVVNGVFYAFDNLDHYRKYLHGQSHSSHLINIRIQ